MVLTDEEVDALRKSLPAVCKHQDAIRAAESAVLEKLKAQKPFAYFSINDYGAWEETSDPTAHALYAYPLPPADVVLDAERYKWLRKVAPNIVWDSHDKEIGFVRFDTKAYLWKPEIFDAAIDAAMKEMK